MAKRIGIEVSAAVAQAVKLADVDVVSAYPITPQTHIVETIADYVANGEFDAEYMNVESEHSALSACLGASAAGARVFTATASQGLALMHEILYVVSGCRLPIVMAIANRALSAPVNIWCDHNDSLAERDSGWIQIYVEDGQEAFDTTLQAFKVAEDHRVLLPLMICLDGFILSHVIEPVTILDKDEVGKFLSPKREPLYRLDPKKPISMGPIGMVNVYFEFKKQLEEAMKSAKEVILEVDEEYGRLFGRRYGLFGTYRLEDADVVLVTMGSMTGTARVAVDKLRKRGKRVGVLKIRVFRPFPCEELKKVLGRAKVVAVVDRNMEPGAQGGVAFTEIRSLLYGLGRKPHIIGFIAGIGGRDITVEDFLNMADKAIEVAKIGVIKEEVELIGVRE